MSQRAINQSIKSLTAEAKALWLEGERIRSEILDRLDESLDRAWRLGKKLNQIKAVVGAGNWLIWLESNWPEMTERNARRLMLLDRENPGAKSIRDLHQDSVRKFRLGYVPIKDRPELDGDQEFSRQPHHLTLVNDWRKWQRRVEIGQASLDPEEAKRDLKPLFDWLCGLYGASGLASK